LPGGQRTLESAHSSGLLFSATILLRASLLSYPPRALPLLAGKALGLQDLGRSHQADDEIVQAPVHPLMSSIGPTAPDAQVGVVDLQTEPSGRHPIEFGSIRQSPSTRRIRRLAFDALDLLFEEHRDVFFPDAYDRTRLIAGGDRDRVPARVECLQESVVDAHRSIRAAYFIIYCQNLVNQVFCFRKIFIFQINDS